jgi:membrane-bound lytic murein transglycosylase A
MPPPTLPDGARLEPIAFADLPGWAADDAAEALAAFRLMASPSAPGATMRPARPTLPAIEALAALALRLPPDTAAGVARGFFEAHFEARRVAPARGEGFLTAYFEPVTPASAAPTATHTHPMLARPGDLVSFAPGEPPPPPLDPGLAAARRTPLGLEPYPTRAMIEAGALGAEAKALAWLDPIDLFFIHVQGSARLAFPDGTLRRVSYAGRNGRPYTSIGKVIVSEGHLPLEGLTLETMTAWLKADRARARAIMQRNESYIFFAFNDDLPPEAGPIGGAGLPLTPHRSLAVDRTIWSYGLPFFLTGRLPRVEGGDEPLARLMIAQDTGTAIVGPARGDYFMGTGPEAGRRAGLVRHAATFHVLWPKDA